MKTFLLFIISFFISVGYGQNNNKRFLIENKGLYPLESFRDSKTGTVLLDKDGLPDLQSRSNSTTKETLPQSFQSNSRIISQQVKYSLRLDGYVSLDYNPFEGLSGKTEFAYDVNGKQILNIQYSWYNITELVPRYKQESTYDVNGKLSFDISYNWDKANQSFVPSDKSEFTSDLHGNSTRSINYKWDIATQFFELSGKTEYTYDINGNNTLSLGYSWNTATQSFVPSYRSELPFYINGSPTLWLFYVYNATTQSLEPIIKGEYASDVNGNETLNVLYSWNSATQSFGIGWHKTETTYDVNGNITHGIYYIWDTATQFFVLSSKTEYTYDVNGNQTLNISYNWNTATQSFGPTSKTEYTYDVNGNQTLMTTYKWYTNLEVYKPSFKQEFSTILDNNTKLVRMGTTFKYDTNFNKWNELVGEQYKSYWYYTKTSLSIEKIENSLISLYPNPTTQMLYISHPEINSFSVEIEDLNGKQMYSGTIQKDVPLDVSNYTQGMYLVTVENKENNKKKTYKIIKK